MMRLTLPSPSRFRLTSYWSMGEQPNLMFCQMLEQFLQVDNILFIYFIISTWLPIQAQGFLHMSLSTKDVNFQWHKLAILFRTAISCSILFRSQRSVIFLHFCLSLLCYKILFQSIPIYMCSTYMSWRSFARSFSIVIEIHTLRKVMKSLSS